MAIKFSNNASTKLAQTLGSTDTTMTVVSGEGAEFPTVGNNEYFLCTLVSASGEMEIVKCTARVGDVFTVVRAQEGTVARAFSVGTVVENRLTAGSLNEVANVEQYVAEVEAAKTAAEAAQTGATQAKTDAEAAKTAAEAAVNSIAQYPPQTIVRALTGSRPDGWTAADCDAPVQSMSAESAVILSNDVLPVFSDSNSSGEMEVSAKSIYNGDYPVWKAFNKQAVHYKDSWQSGDDFVKGPGVGSSWIQVDMGRPFNVARIVLYPRNEESTFLITCPYDFDIVIDGVKVKEVRDVIPPSCTARMEFDLDSPVTGQIVRLDITRTGGANLTSLGQFYVYDAEVVSGSALVQIASGLQVAYADEGRVQLSEVLYSAHTLDLSPAADGTHYVYADIAEDGTFSGFGLTANKPMVGIERSGAGDLYNPVTVTHYNSSDVPIRRVYLGWVKKYSGVITDVHCYVFGDSVTIPVRSGLINLNTQYTLNYPFPGGPKDMIVSEFAEIKFDNEWYSAKASSHEGQGGVGVNLQKDVIAVVSKADNLLHGLPGATGSSYSGVNITAAPCRIHVKRGY